MNKKQRRHRERQSRREANRAHREAAELKVREDAARVRMERADRARAADLEIAGAWKTCATWAREKNRMRRRYVKKASMDTLFKRGLKYARGMAGNSLRPFAGQDTTGDTKGLVPMGPGKRKYPTASGMAKHRALVRSGDGGHNGRVRGQNARGYRYLVGAWIRGGKRMPIGRMPGG